MFESSGSYNDALANIQNLYDDNYDYEENIEDEDDLARIIPPKVNDTKECLKARHILGIMGFLGFANVYAMRVNLSVAIVAMVNNSFIPQENNSVSDVCPYIAVNSTVPQKNGSFNWDESTQSIVLGAFFYGYVLTQIPGGRFAELFGGKLVYGFGILMTAIFTLLTPIAAKWNFPMFIAVRILEGVGEGVTYPSMHAMLAKWIPPLERSTFAAIVYAGSNFGTIISLPLSGYLCTLDFMDGWPLAFYIFGFLGIVWFVFWCYLVYDSPMKHPRIDPQEQRYILASIGPQSTDNDKSSIPWKKMACCLPLWAILITQCGQSWAFYTQLTELPSYMKNILHLDIEQNAVLSAIPYLTAWLAGIFFSLSADLLLLKGWISPANSMKLYNSLGSIVPSIGLIFIGWAGCNTVLVQWLLGVTGAFAGATYAGNQMNHISLNPKYAGTMYGITNAAANTCGFLAPLVVGAITEGNETLSKWRTVFYLAASINIGGNLFYVIFGSAKEQNWSDTTANESNILESNIQDEPEETQ